jgi:tetratricopeptide (TPR) repeat protein
MSAPTRPTPAERLADAAQRINRHPRLTALALGFSALALYLATLTPSIPPTDSGELILAAWLPGVAHAPGFPLWVVLGWLTSHLLPVGSVPQRLNAMSAWWGAAAVGMTYLLLRAALLTAPLEARDQKPGINGDLRVSGLWLPAVWIAVAVTILFAVSRTLWSWSVVAEVYSLHIFLVATILWLLLVWRQRVQEGESAGRWLILAALVYGLALGNHNLTIGLLAPAILFWLWINRRGLSWSLIALSALALALGALIYLYLPWRAAQDPLLNWGDPHNLERLWWHVTGKQYRVNLFGGTPASMARELGAGLLLWAQQFTSLAVPLLLGGVWALWRRDRALTIFTLLIAIFGVSYAVIYEIADDRDAYYLASFLVSTLWLAAAWRWLSAWAMGTAAAAVKDSGAARLRPGARAAVAPNRPKANRPARGGRNADARPAALDTEGAAPSARPAAWRRALPFALLLLPLLALVWNGREDDHRHYTYPATYAQNALDEAGPNALILTGDWQLVAPLLTLQFVNQDRPDVAVVDVLLFQNRPWYHRQIELTQPALLAPVAAEHEAFLTKLRQFESDQLAAGDTEIQQRYTALWRALMASALATRPVYATPDALGHLRQFGLDLSSQALPGGVLLRILPQAPTQPPALAPLTWNVTPFLEATAAGRFLDEPARKIRRAHAIMAVNRGTFHARANLSTETLSDLQLATRIDPTYTLAFVLLAEAQQGQGDTTAARQSLQAALALEPDNVQVQQRLAALK